MGKIIIYTFAFLLRLHMKNECGYDETDCWWQCASIGQHHAIATSAASMAAGTVDALSIGYLSTKMLLHHYSPFLLGLLRNLMNRNVNLSVSAGSS